MKNILFALFVILSLPIFASDELKFEPSYAIGVGYQTGPMLSEETKPYIVAKTFLFRDMQLDKANLLGLGLSLNTRGQAQVVLSPLSFYANNIYVSPDIGFGIGKSPNKLGLSIAYGF